MIRAAALALFLATTAQAQSVLTYHNDTLRTGWNPHEVALTTANVAGGTFNLQATVKLDSQVDGQPLIVPSQAVGGQSARAVVYVATGNNTLYAIDAASGAILASRNFGTAVPQSALPGQCNNNGPTIGITSTPVISLSRGALYLVSDTYENDTPVFRVHQVSLATLADIAAPATVTASGKLADGTTYQFNSTGSRQRAALLLSGSTLYAAFSSYCDQAQNTTRGWMLGWNADTLKPLAHNSLTDSTPVGQSGNFLNSIWMSGFGPATVSANNVIYAVTSNSDKNTYGAANRDESIVMLPANLDGIQSYFTDPNHAAYDDQDRDLGSGGAMLPPDQPGENPKLLFAAGKAGTMYMMDRSNGLAVLNRYAIGGCWCGPSYFQGADGRGRVITSGGNTAMVWRLNTSATATATLKREYSTTIVSGQEGGFFTSVSSDGRQPGTAIVWAVGRPTSAPGSMALTAIDPTTGQVIFTGTAGNWTGGNSNANTVPTIAGGHVYVATYQEMTIFGLGSPASIANRAAAAAARRQADRQGPVLPLAAGEHAIWGTILAVSQSDMWLLDRGGAKIRVALAAARQAGNVASPVVGQAALAIGRPDTVGTLLASHVEHAKPSPRLWPADQ